MSAVLTRPTAARVATAAGLVAGVTLLARAVGFGRWLVFSANVGTGCTGTAYTTANQLPNVLFELAAGGGLAAVVVPLVRREVVSGRRRRAEEVASALLTWTVTVLAPAAVLLAVLARPLVGLLLPPSSCPGALRTASAMVVVFAPQVVLYGVGMVLAGVLHAHGRFLAAALAPLLSSVVVVGGYLGFGALAEGAPSTAALALLSGGTTAGVAALSLPLLVPVRRAGVRLRVTWRWPAGTARRAAALAAAAVVGAVAMQLAVVVLTRVVNGHGGAGSLPVYLYLQAVYLLPYAVLSLPLAVAAFPALTSGTHGAPTRAVERLAQSTRAVLVTGTLGAAVLVATAPQVGRLFAQVDRGSSTSGGGAALAAMPAALTALAPALAGLGVTALLTRALYTHGDARHAAGAMTAGWAVVALAPLLILHGVTGPRATLTTVGWSTTAGMTVAAGLLVVAVVRGWGPRAVHGAPRTAAASLVAGVTAALVGRGAGDACTHVLGAGVPATLLAAVVGATVALGVLLAAWWLLDRDGVTLAGRRGRR